MQRILLILTEFPPRVGGMQTHAMYLTRHLAQRGYRIEVFTYRVHEAGLAQEALAYDRAQPFTVHRVLGRLSYHANLKLLAQEARRFRPDLIYSSTVFYGILQKELGVPVVCRCVGNDVLRPWLGYPYPLGSGLLNFARLEMLLHAWLEKDAYPEWIEALFRRKRERLAAASARTASLILANSTFTAGLLQGIQVPASHIRVLVGGVDSRRFRKKSADRKALRRDLRLPENAFLLMTACRIVAKKGIDLLLAAMQALRSRLPHAHLVIIGDGKYRQRYMDACAAKGIANITFAGRVAHEQIHRYYAACDLFVLASRESINRATGTRDVETMGRVLCEANAAGIPVVASRSGGIPSVIEDSCNGLLFEPDDVDELVRRICQLHDDPGLCRHLAREGQRRAQEEFDWNNIMRVHEEVFGDFRQDELRKTGTALPLGIVSTIR